MDDDYLEHKLREELGVTMKYVRGQRNMTDAERLGLVQPVDWNHPDAGRILPAPPPAPDYTEDGLMAIEVERE